MQVSKFFAAVLILISSSAFADIDVACEGGGHTINLRHLSGELGSKSESALIDGQITSSTLVEKNGQIFRFSLDGNSLVYTFDYDLPNARASLTSQSGSVDLFCQRY
jgi:hypothetical protein